jgi:hypothetical protein
VQLLGHGIGVRRPVRPVHVEVHDHLGGVGDVGQQSGQRPEGRRQPCHVGHQGDQVQPLAVQVVLGGDAGVPVEPGRPHVLQAAAAVVAAGEHLEDRVRDRCRAVEALRQQPDQRLGAGDQRLHLPDALRGVPTGRRLVELVEQPRSPVEDLLPGGAQDRLLEVPVADGPGQVAHRRVAQLGGDHQPVEHLPDLRARRPVGQPVGGQPAVQQRRDRGPLLTDALLGEEDPVHRLGQRRARLQVLHAVVGQRPPQPGEEGLRQPLPLGVEGVQVGLEVLPRTVDLGVGLLLLAGRPVAGELAQVGEGDQHVELGGQQLCVVDGELVAGGRVLGDQLPRVPAADVVAGDQCPQRRQPGPRAGPRVAVRRLLPARQGHALAGGLLEVAAGAVEAEQRSAGVDLAVHRGPHLADPTGERRPHRRLHLHALEDDDRLTGLDLVARRDADGDDHGRGGRADDPADVPAHPVRLAVDLHQGGPGGVDGDHRVPPSADGEPALQGAEPVHLDVDDPAVEPDPVPVPVHRGDGQPVDLPAHAQLDGAAHLVRRPRPATAGRGQERQPLLLLLGLGQVDGDLHERHPRVADGPGAVAGAGTVQPPGVGGARHDLRAVEQVEQEGLGGGAAPQDDGGLLQGAAQPGEGLGAVPAPRDHLGDHRVVLRRDGVTDADPGVHADAGPGRQPQQLDPAGRRGEALLGVLGGEPCLDGVPVGRGRVALEPAPRGHVQLQLHQVQPGGLLGHRVLHLQPGVDLEERGELLLRLVEELDGARADVARGPDQRDGGLTQGGVLLRAQRRRAGLLEDLLVAPLHRAVAHTGRPHRAVLVGDDLHLDVPAALDQPLHEDDRVAEALLRLRPGARQRLLQLGLRADDPDPAAPAAAAGLDDQRVADGVGVPPAVVGTLDRAVAPRRDRHPGLLGEHLRLDLGAEQPHGLRGRPDEGHAEVGAQLGEGGVLGDEAPADPGRVGAAGAQGPGQLGVVEVRAARAAPAEQDRLVGGAHERRPALLLGVQRHDPGARAVLGIELPHRTDQPQGRLSTVHDGDAVEHPSTLLSSVGSCGRRLGGYMSRPPLTPQT